MTKQEQGYLRLILAIQDNGRFRIKTKKRHTTHDKR